MVKEPKSPAVYIGWENGGWEWRLVEIKPGRAAGVTLAEGREDSAEACAAAVKRAQEGLEE